MTDMLTAKDVQEMLQVDRSTVYRMAEAERLPAIKVGRQWRFPTDQMQLWLPSKQPGRRRHQSIHHHWPNSSR